MSTSFKVDVAPAVLAWARHAAHLSKEDVGRKLAPRPDAVGRWTERVQAWEDGDEQPSLAQLRNLAEVYRRPLPVFLLREPPVEPREAQDFRRPSEVGEMPPALAFAMREARERREVATELLGSDEPRWSLSAEMSEPAEDVAARIREALFITFEAQRERGLAAWRDAVEAAGVLVFGFSGIESTTASGFALTKGTDLPAIGLNNRDAPTRRVFTLLHELVHVTLRTEDVLCDLSDDSPANAATERYCNHVAGAVVVPASALLAHAAVVAHRGSTWTDAEGQKLARDFNVSREVIMRRLVLLGRTTQEHYRAWRARFRSDQRDYEEKLEGATGGPTYARKHVSQLGRRYVQLVLSAADRERISLSDASQYLGVKVDQFPSLVAELRGEAA